MRIRFTILGFELWALELGDQYELVEDEEDTAIGGGSFHDFERDLYAPDPGERHNHEYDDRSFGFS